MTTTPTCTHAVPADCHNVDLFVCPEHFSNAMADMMCASVVNDQSTFVQIVMHLVEHAWLTPAISTLCGFIEMYGPDPGESQEDAAARVRIDTGVYGHDGIPDEDQAQHGVWLFRAGLLTRSAIFGDGQTIFDTIASIAPDPNMDARSTLSILATLSQAAHHSIDIRDQVTQQTVALGMMIGGQTYNPYAYNLLAPVVDLTESIRTHRPWDDRLQARFMEARQMELISMVGTCGRAVGQLITADGPEVILSTNRADPAAGMTGLLDWRDETVDPGRDPQHLAICRAVRVAAAFARNDGDRVVTMSEQGDPVERRRWAMDVIGGAASMLAMMVNSRVVADQG